MTEARSGFASAAPAIGTVYGVLLNTRAEMAARAEAFTRSPYKQPPRAPVLYIKTPNTILEPDGEVPVPGEVDCLEANATLAAVFQRAATRVAAADALSYLAGLTTAIDICVPHPEVFRPAVRQRCRDHFLPLRRELSPVSSVGDPGALAIAVEVNGSQASRFSTADLIRPLPELISELSVFMTFLPGDVLLVGLNPEPARARVGDHVRARIDGLAPLSCRLVAEASAGSAA